MSELSSVAGTVQRAVSGFLELIVLEARRAGLSLVWMIALGFAAAILAVSAWIGLVFTLVLCAVALGLSPILSVLLLVVLNLAGAAGAVYACMQFSKDLMFPASRRQLSTNVSAPPPHA